MNIDFSFLSCPVFPFCTSPIGETEKWKLPLKLNSRCTFIIAVYLRYIYDIFTIYLRFIYDLFTIYLRFIYDLFTIY